MLLTRVRFPVCADVIFFKEIINAIKIIYSNEKIKISSNDDYININNGVLQGSLLSQILFNIYI